MRPELLTIQTAYTADNAASGIVSKQKLEFAVFIVRKKLQDE